MRDSLEAMDARADTTERKNDRASGTTTRPRNEVRMFSPAIEFDEYLGEIKQTGSRVRNAPSQPMALGEDECSLGGDAH
jgi:hypothetical protein